jgi:hypothetical protein
MKLQQIAALAFAASTAILLAWGWIFGPHHRA